MACTIRPARHGDEDMILSLLRALADYEKLLDRFHITKAVIARDYLCDRPLIQCDLAFEGERPVGIATWYWTYASFAAQRGLYLEDLFVPPEFRGHGYGKALLAHLSKTAVKEGAGKMEWSVLPWNRPSIDFYEGLGAQRMTDWHIYRLTGEALEDVGDFMSRISLVLAMASNGVIGANGAIPWRIAEDMKHFKAVTMGKPIVMGRKTWDSFPKTEPPGRANIVVTRDRGWRGAGAVAVHSLGEAVLRAESEKPDEIAVIGGAEIYKLALPRADLVHLTQVHVDFAGDTHMPPFDSEHWRETARDDHQTAEGPRYSFVTLERRAKAR